MSESTLKLGELPSTIVPGPVPYAVLLPPGYEDARTPLPLCLSLHGGGGDRDGLAAMQPVFEEWWADGSLAPMVIAAPSVGVLSFYADEPGGPQWEAFIAREFLSHVRGKYRVRGDREGTVMTGASMGGHGTLKIAFARPDEFLAIAALEPAIEPGFTRDQSPPRSWLYATEGVNEQMLGDDADPTLFEANSPAARLKRNAEAIRDSGMAIYLEVGDHDALNLQDGTEFLHRALWDLDISHEYHLVKDADHVGPTLLARNHEAFQFLSRALREVGVPEASSELPPGAQEWIDYQAGGMTGPAPEFNFGGADGPAVLRRAFEPRRQELAERDPTVARRYGVLPPSS